MREWAMSKMGQKVRGGGMGWLSSRRGGPCLVTVIYEYLYSQCN